MSAVYPSYTGAMSRMNGIPGSSRRPVGKNCSGTRKFTNAVRSPNQAKGRWNQSRTPRSRSHARCMRAASRSVMPGSSIAATASAHSYASRWTVLNPCNSAESSRVTAEVMPPPHLSTSTAVRARNLTLANVTVVRGCVNSAAAGLWKSRPMWKTGAASFDLRVTPRVPYVWSLTSIQLCGVTTGVVRVTTFEA